MALHTQLPIYKVAYDLLGVVTQATRRMPRDFKRSIGGRKPKPAAQAEEPIADKTDGKTYPAPASPGNEAATPPELVIQPSGDVKNAFPDPWPFPKGCRI